MSLPLSETMLKALHALRYASESHGTPGPKRAGVVAMYASMGRQIDRTLPALERRGYVERAYLSGELCWLPTDAGRALLDQLAQASAEARRREEEAMLHVNAGPRHRLSPLASRVGCAA